MNTAASHSLPLLRAKLRISHVVVGANERRLYSQASKSHTCAAVPETKVSGGTWASDSMKNNLMDYQDKRILTMRTCGSFLYFKTDWSPSQMGPLPIKNFLDLLRLTRNTSYM